MARLCNSSNDCLLCLCPKLLFSSRKSRIIRRNRMKCLLHVFSTINYGKGHCLGVVRSRLMAALFVGREHSCMTVRTIEPLILAIKAKEPNWHIKTYVVDYWLLIWVLFGLFRWDMASRTVNRFSIDADTVRLLRHTNARLPRKSNQAQHFTPQLQHKSHLFIENFPSTYVLILSSRQ